MIPIHQPFFELSDLLAVVRRHPAAAAFEGAMADVVGARFGLLFSDGRVAFRVGLESLGIVGAEVVLPACTCPSMAEAVMASGNEPVFADVRTEDFCLRPGSLEEALTPRTRAVVVAHMLGYRADVAEIKSRLAARDILLIEDYAQYLMPKAQMAGLYRGDFAVLSFSRGKPISTVSGGLLVTNSERIYEKALAFRRQHVAPPSPRAVARKLAWFAGAYLLKRRWCYASWQRFRRLMRSRAKALGAHPRGPTSSSLPPAPAEFQARLGLNQLSKLSRMSETRRAWAARLAQSLPAHLGLRTAPLLADASFVRLPIWLGTRDRLAFRDAMRSQGVIVGHTWEYALPFSSQYRRQAGSRRYPGAEKIYREAVELPAFPGLSERDRTQIVRAVERAMAGGG